MSLIRVRLVPLMPTFGLGTITPPVPPAPPADSTVLADVNGNIFVDGSGNFILDSATTTGGGPFGPELVDPYGNALITSSGRSLVIPTDS